MGGWVGGVCVVVLRWVVVGLWLLVIGSWRLVGWLVVDVVVGGGGDRRGGGWWWLLYKPFRFSSQEVCKDPTPVSQLSLDLLRPVKDVRSSWALVRRLEEAGWRWERLPSRPGPEHTAYTAGSAKIWRTRTAELYKSYLQCLLTAEQIFERGVAAIPHGKQPSVYKDLLNDRPRAAGAIPIEGDVAVHTDREPMVSDIAAPGSEGSDADMEDDWLHALEEAMLGECGAGSPTGSAGGVTPVAIPPVGTTPVGAAPSPSAAVGSVLIACPSTPVMEVTAADLADIRKTNYWGCFTLTPVAKGRFGRWQAACPFHRKNDVTNCKRSIKVLGPDKEDQIAALWRMRHWCNIAKDFDRQQKHVF